MMGPSALLARTMATALPVPGGSAGLKGIEANRNKQKAEDVEAAHRCSMERFGVRQTEAQRVSLIYSGSWIAGDSFRQQMP